MYRQQQQLLCISLSLTLNFHSGFQPTHTHTCCVAAGTKLAIARQRPGDKKSLIWQPTRLRGDKNKKKNNCSALNLTTHIQPLHERDRKESKKTHTNRNYTTRNERLALECPGCRDILSTQLRRQLCNSTTEHIQPLAVVLVLLCKDVLFSTLHIQLLLYLCEFDGEALELTVHLITQGCE